MPQMRSRICDIMENEKEKKNMRKVMEIRLTHHVPDMNPSDCIDNCKLAKAYHAALSSELIKHFDEHEVSVENSFIFDTSGTAPEPIIKIDGAMLIGESHNNIEKVIYHINNQVYENLDWNSLVK